MKSSAQNQSLAAQQSGESSPLSASAFDDQGGGKNMAAPPFQLKEEGIVQRIVDPTQTTQSPNGLYMVPNGDQTTLYSRRDAPAPVPASLYQRSEETTSGEAPRELYSWTPNARLFSDAEQGIAQTTRTKNVPSRGLCGLAGHLGMEDQVPDHGMEDGLIDTLRGRIDGEEGSPSKGIIGKNDCGEFATHLQHMIGAGPDAPGPLAHADDRDIRVGDRMKHNLTDPDDCPHHYATVVAEDGPSKVTLEANAGADLSAPEFHLRNGVQGFMDANNEDFDNGEDFEIRRLDDDTAEGHKAALAGKKLNADESERETYRTVGGRKISSTVADI